MNIPSFDVMSLPWAEIWTLSVYHPMGALAGLKMEMTRVLCSWDSSCACQLPPLVSLESGNTALVLANSEGEGPVRKTGVSRNKGVLQGSFEGHYANKCHITVLETTGKIIQAKSLLICSLGPTGSETGRNLPKGALNQ